MNDRCTCHLNSSFDWRTSVASTRRQVLLSDGASIPYRDIGDLAMVGRFRVVARLPVIRSAGRWPG